jgi:hypothetical protein
MTETEALRAENARLRAALAHSKDPCTYCALPADKFAECAHGFPGCGRADDMTGCPEFGATLAIHEIKDHLMVLARTHTNEDDLVGFHILMGVAPLHRDRREYLEAWRAVRQFLHLKTEPVEGMEGMR